MSIIRWIHSRITDRIANRLTAMFVLLCTLLVAGLSTLYYYNITTEKHRDYTEYNLSILRQGNINLKGTVDELDRQVKALYASNWVWEQVAPARQAGGGSYLAEQQILSSMLNLYTVLGDINRVALYIPRWGRLYVMDGKTLESGGGSVTGNDFVTPGVSPADVPWYAQALEEPASLVITAGGAPYPFPRLGNGQQSYRFARMLLDPFTGEPIMALCLEMNKDKMAALLSKMLLPGEDIYLLDGSQEPVYARDPQRLPLPAEQNPGQGIRGRDEGSYRVAGPEPLTVIYSKTGIRDWYTYKSISDKVLNSRLHSGLLVYLLFSAAMILMGVIAVVFTSIQFTTPIKQLIGEMKRYDGSEPPGRGIARKDELGQLQEKFYDMGVRLHLLISTEYLLKIRERDARINAIQARMNPHFLNNALQTISALAVKRGNTDIEHVTQCLKAILQYNLNRTGGLTTLRNELKNIRSYLEIQRYRYPDSLLTTYDISPDALATAIPAFVLQPVLENCFKHGKDEATPLLHIHVSAHVEESTVMIEITDNGKGFDPRQMAEITQRFQREYAYTEMEERGNGLIMVNSLIRLSMGPEYGVTLANGEPHGARVLLCLPRGEQENV